MQEIDSKLQSYIQLTADQSIQTICQPFFKHTQLSFLLYIRHFKNNQRLWLTTHGNWLEYYFKKQYHLINVFETSNSIPPSGNYLWSTLSGQQVFLDAKIYFNIDYGIILVNHLKNYTEFIHLASTPDNPQILNLYCNHLSWIYQFIFYFRETAKNWIDRAEKNMLPPLINTPFPPNVVKSPLKALDLPHQHRKLLTEQYRFATITARETECINWLKKGKTATEIALILGTSKRTVEAHIKSIKAKLQCYNSFQLGYKIGQIDFYRI